MQKVITSNGPDSRKEIKGLAVIMDLNDYYEWKINGLREIRTAMLSYSVPDLGNLRVNESWNPAFVSFLRNPDVNESRYI